ncbi:hypothetical protein TWF106_005865 [Orbilia oligospora]|uniref:Uncharacterized protein n=1 Tax=Orbilia oligospora TaxID=2813651 RepID=A0A6G1M430_ORBOL|nr:hypothetical protein TWF679_007266 [Orbilia oligospora]KAF3222085.1 hypothetical protein TWF106_005865 [Orbilia oligospora]KAF3227784.1 hypothetical protein TWF191_003306 [Orbilia oligospora]KAF3244450.1 hypothetical protein TWF192_007744 [Orbilia oligospora]
MSSTLRHRKTSSEPNQPSISHHHHHTREPSLMEQSSSNINTSRQVQVTSLSLTSLLTTLTTTEGITTTARKLYTYPTKRLSSSDLFRRSRSDVEDVVISSSSSNSSSGAITPPPDYEEESLALTTRSPSSSSTSSTAISLQNIINTSQKPEDPSLVSAKFAMQGHNLLSLSLAEPANSSFRRHLYLDSLTYLLRALPSDLSPSETTQLISSLPPAVVESLEPVVTEGGGGGGREKRVYEHPTIHYFLLVLTATTVSSIRNLTPHLKSLAQSTWEYNLRYRVAERGYDRVRKTVDGGFAFWKAVAEWVMFDDRSIRDEGMVAVNNGRKLRYGGGVVRDVGKYAGGVIRSGVGGMVEGFVEGMK